MINKILIYSITNALHLSLCFLVFQAVKYVKMQNSIAAGVNLQGQSETYISTIMQMKLLATAKRYNCLFVFQKKFACGTAIIYDSV